MSSRIEIDPDERAVAGEAAKPPRRGWGRVLLLTILVAGLAGGSWWAGHGDKRAAQDLGALPVIHPDSAPVKEPPRDPGGMVVPDQDSVLLNHDDKPKIEELLPPPEAAKPRPVAAVPAPPAQPPVAPVSPPITAAAPTANAAPPPDAPRVVAPAPPPTPAAPAVSPASTAAAKVAAAATTAAPKMAPAASAGGGYRLQLGALKTEDAAKQAWLRLQRQQPEVLGKLSLTVSRIDLGDRGIFYRIQAGPIADAAEAARSCAVLKSRNIGCILVKP